MPDFKNILIVFLGAMIIHSQFKITDLTTEIGSLENELTLTQTSLAAAEAKATAVQTDNAAKDKSLVKVNTILQKCYSDLNISKAAYAEIEEIMHTQDDTPDTTPTLTVTTPRAAPVTSKQERLGLGFANKQLKRITGD